MGVKQGFWQVTIKKYEIFLIVIWRMAKTLTEKSTNGHLILDNSKNPINLVELLDSLSHYKLTNNI